ncbi:MAG: mycofactocin biosynthesis glycosyltransferase MftF [Microthrixaceae bacterium]
MTPVRIVADTTLRRLGPRTWAGGAPMRVLRLSERGSTIVQRIASGEGWCPGEPAELALADRLVAGGAAHPSFAGESPPPPVAAEVTLVVPVRDDPDGLARVLRMPGGLAGCEVVVVDDASAEPTSVAELAAATGARLVRHPTARGPAAARNSGLALVDTPLVLFADADVDLTGVDLGLLAAHLGRSEVAAVAPRVRGTGGRGRTGRHDRNRGPLDMGPVPSTVRPGAPVAYVPTATLLARAGTLRAVGGFDESLRFGEDVDLVWRLVAAGMQVRYEPATVVHHRVRSGTRAWLRQRYEYGTSAGGLARRHPGKLAPVVVSPWSLLAWGASLAGQPLVATSVVAGSTVALLGRLRDADAAAVTRVVLEGHLLAGRQLARAVLRPWWPAAVLAAVASRRARRVVAACVAVEVATSGGPPAQRILGLLDHLAYSAGVWSSAVRTRTVGPLLPRTGRLRVG